MPCKCKTDSDKGAKRSEVHIELVEEGREGGTYREARAAANKVNMNMGPGPTASKQDQELFRARTKIMGSPVRFRNENFLFFVVLG